MFNFRTWIRGLWKGAGKGAEPKSVEPKDAGPKDFKEYQELVSARVDTINDSAWLNELHKFHADRFKIENDRIWETGKIFVPLAFAAFGAFAQLKDAGPVEVGILGVASTGLLGLWHLIALTHRHFQEVHRSWTSVIQARMPLPPPADPSRGSSSPAAAVNKAELKAEVKTPPKDVNLNRVRLWLIVVVAVAWAVIFVVVMVFRKPKAPSPMDVNVKNIEVKLGK